MEGRLSVPYGKIWYEVKGKDQKGTPLIAILGGPGVPHNYLKTIELLADKRPAVFYDQLGCGESDKPEERTLWRIERFVKEIECLVAELGFPKPFLLGQSWRTVLACEYSLKHPDRVKGLVLSGTAMSISRFEEDARRLMVTLSDESRAAILEAEKSGDFGKPGYQDAISEFYSKYVCRMETWPECMNDAVAGMGEEVYNYVYGPSEFTVTGTLKGYDLSPRLSEIEIPVLLTCGEYDEATPETPSFYASKFRNATVRVFEDASHEHHLEKTVKYIQEVRSFLDRIEN